MPVIQVNLIKGRSEEQKQKLVEELTEACVKAIAAPKQSVRIIINEVSNENFGIGGETAKKLGR